MIRLVAFMLIKDLDLDIPRRRRSILSAQSRLQVDSRQVVPKTILTKIGRNTDRVRWIDTD